MNSVDNSSDRAGFVDELKRAIRDGKLTSDEFENLLEFDRGETIVQDSFDNYNTHRFSRDLRDDELESFVGDVKYALRNTTDDLQAAYDDAVADGTVTQDELDTLNDAGAGISQSTFDRIAASSTRRDSDETIVDTGSELEQFAELITPSDDDIDSITVPDVRMASNRNRSRGRSGDYLSYRERREIRNEIDDLYSEIRSLRRSLA